MVLSILLSVAHAADPESPAPDAVASRDALEVEMPAVHVRATPGGVTPWRRLPDGMAAEMALAGAGVSPDDASVITVDREPDHTRVAWTELTTGDVRLRVERPSTETVCTALVRGGIWSGSGSVQVYQPTPGREEAVHNDLGFLLVEDHPTVGALVSLAPGDSVTVTNARRNGELLHEWVEVKRPAGVVTVDRKPQGERICYSAD
jgi:hypothetical protein